MRRGPSSWTADEWYRILLALDELSSDHCGKAKLPSKVRILRRVFWRAYLLVARDTGLSWRQILELRRDQVAPNGTIVVHFDNPSSAAVMRLRNDTLAAIEEGKFDGHRLLQYPYHREQMFAEHWRRIVTAAGIDRRAISPTETAIPSDQHIVFPEPRPPDGTRKTLAQFYLQYYQPLRLVGRSQRTDTLYKYTIANFGRYLGHAPTLADLTDQRVGGLLQWMSSRGLAPHSLAKEYDQLLAMWRFACRKNLVREYPTLPRPNRPDRVPIAWMPDELHRLFASLDTLPGKVGTVSAAAFWRALLLTLYDTGERIAAIMQLEWQHFDFNRRYVRIPAEFRKGKHRDKVSKLRPETVTAIKAIQTGAYTLVFEWPMAASSLWKFFGVVLKRAGLPHDRKSKFHRMRRTVASLYESAGGDAMKLLDHSSRCVTAKYLDPRLVQVKHACDLLPNPLANPNETSVA
jgi:integrase